MCPLLVETKDGLRCSANTPEVRPFWGRALGYYGGAVLGVYVIAVLSVFGFLRTIGYPVSILHVGLPPLWHKVGQARGWYFLDRSSKAFAEGRTAEGLLYLDNSYEFDPTNYAAGLLLAKTLQASQPARSDKVFQQLMREHPAKRHATAQDWFRALLARGSFDKVVALARTELGADTEHAAQWMRALLFATRQTDDDNTLRELLAAPSPAMQTWHRLLQVELLLRDGRTTEARTALLQPWAADAGGFTLFYRINTLIELRDAFAAVDVLSQHPGVLDDEANITLQLDSYAVARSSRRHQLADELLASRVTRTNLAIVKVLCAHLVRYPDRELFDRLAQKMEREQLPLNGETHGIWFSLLCTAGVVGDRPRLQALTSRLRQASPTPFLALAPLENFFLGENRDGRIAGFLTVIPLPLEMTYALHERYPARSTTPAAAAPPRP